MALISFPATENFAGLFWRKNCRSHLFCNGHLILSVVGKRERVGGEGEGGARGVDVSIKARNGVERKRNGRRERERDRKKKTDG